jgi:hypothetical protein
LGIDRSGNFVRNRRTHRSVPTHIIVDDLSSFHLSARIAQRFSRRWDITAISDGFAKI